MTTVMTNSLPEVKVSRIKRKPVPTIDVSARYPPPDPNDPFAPLWILRHRSSSALHGLSPNQEASSPLDRQHSQSALHPAALKLSALDGTLSPPVPVMRPHYRRRSQSTLAITSPTTALSISMTSPVHLMPPTPWPVHNGAEETSDSSGTETDTLVVSSGEDGTTEIRPRAASAHNRFARLLRSKKSSVSNEKPLLPVDSARVHKSTISSPVISTLLWDAGGQRFIPIHDNPLYNTAVPILSNSISFDTYHLNGIKQGIGASPHVTPRKPVLPVQTKNLSSSTPMRSPNQRRLSITQLVPSLSGSSFVHVSPSENVPRFSRSSPRPLSVHSFIRPQEEKVEQPLPPLKPTTSAEWTIPTLSNLGHVATLPIIDETGRTIPFGSLFASQRAIVVFIRHFWCPLCQDYLSSVTSLVRPELLSYDGEKRKSMQLVVIGNGAPGLIKKYRQMIGLPFNMYSDPTLAIYSALGMESVRNADVRHSIDHPRRREVEKSTVIVRKDRGYVKHGLMAGIAVAFVRAIKVGMPVWEKGGNVAQLGGEFVLGPGLTCLYAHGMKSSKGHAPIQDALYAAGFRWPSAKVSRPLPESSRCISSPTTLSGKPQSRKPVETQTDEETWTETRKRSLDQMKTRKAMRRSAVTGSAGPRISASCSALGLLPVYHLQCDRPVVQETNLVEAVKG